MSHEHLDTTLFGEPAPQDPRRGRRQRQKRSRGRSVLVLVVALVLPRVLPARRARADAAYLAELTRAAA